MSHIYGRGYYTSSSTSTNSLQQHTSQPIPSNQQYNFNGDSDDFEYDSSALTSRGNKRPYPDTDLSDKRQRLSNDHHRMSSNNINSFDRNARDQNSVNGYNSFSSNNKNDNSYPKENNGSDFHQGRSNANGYTSSDVLSNGGLFQRRNNLPSLHNQNYATFHETTQNHFRDQYNDGPSRPNLPQPGTGRMSRPRFDNHYPPNHPHTNHPGPQLHPPQFDNNLIRPPRQQMSMPFNSNRFPSSIRPPNPGSFNSSSGSFPPQLRPDPRVSSEVPSSISPPRELMMPVFQTRDRVEQDWASVMTSARQENILKR